MTEPTKAAPTGPNGESSTLEAMPASAELAEKKPVTVGEWIDIILYRKTPGSDRPIAFMACALKQLESIAQSLSTVDPRLADIRQELSETRAELAEIRAELGKRPQARARRKPTAKAP